MDNDAVNKYIGSLIRNASTLESLVFAMACGLAGVQQSVGGLLFHDGFEYRAKNISRVAAVVGLSEPLRGELSQWLKDAIVAYRNRSFVAHANWLQHEDNESIQGAMGLKRAVRSDEFTMVTEAELSEQVRHSREVVSTGMALWERLQDEAPGLWPNAEGYRRR